jgi:hypothetical protein
MKSLFKKITNKRDDEKKERREEKREANLNELNNKINNIAQKREEAITETPEQRRENKLKELNNNLFQARSTYNSAPLNLQIAEKQYYTLKDGPVEYEKQQFNKYKIEAEKLKKDMLIEHNENMNSTIETLAYYNSQQMYSNNVNTIKLTLLENIMQKIKEIQREYSDKTTNNRKTYYILEEQESVIFWLQFVNYCIISFVIVFIIYSVRENHVTNYTYLFTIGGMIIVFYLEPIIKLIKSIPLSFNVYTAWGEDTEKPTNTFLIVFVISVILFFIIYKKNQAIDNYFK